MIPTDLKYVTLWGTGTQAQPAAKTLTTLYDFSSIPASNPSGAMHVPGFNQMALYGFISGGPPTSIEYMFEFSFDDNSPTTWYPEQDANGLYFERSWPLNATSKITFDSTHVGGLRHIPLGSVRWMRMLVKYSGGAAPSGIWRATFGSMR